MSTPRTDKLFFPYGRDATAAASPSLLVCMTQFEILERENAALRDLLERSKVAIWWGVNDEYDHSAKDAAAILLRDIDAAIKEEGK